MKLILLFTFVLILLTLLRLVGNTSSWIIDMLSHFPVQYGVLCLVLVPIFMSHNMPTMAVICCGLALLNFTVLGPVKSNVVRTAAGTEIEVYSANLRRGNDRLRNLTKDLMRRRPDIIFLVEATPEQATLLEGVARKYPYRYEAKGPEYDCLFIFLSKWPMLDAESIIIDNHAKRPVLSSRLQIHDHVIQVYGLHPHSPSRRTRFQARNRQLKWISDRVGESKITTIVLGDLNITPYSPSFRKYIGSSRLRDAVGSAGWRPSWPSFLPFAWIPIDHVLVSEDIAVREVHRGPFIWSDHFPIIARLVIGNSSRQIASL